jgi:hypothetical protein
MAGRNNSVSDQESEKGETSDLPLPEQNEFPDLERIRNRRSQSRQASTKQQTEKEQIDYKPTSTFWKPSSEKDTESDSAFWQPSSKKDTETWRDMRAESLARDRRQGNDRLRRVKSMSNIYADSGTGGLMEVLSHLSKPIMVLSDKGMRDDDRRLDRNIQHLNKITPSNLRNAITEDLSSFTSHLSRIDKQINNLQEVHKLASRVDTAKKVPIKILLEYPLEDATPTIYRQAAHALQQLVKNIGTIKGLTIQKDSYCYILEICYSSNVISNQYILSELQQMSLILDCLDTNSSEYGVLSRCVDLQDLFSSISTFAPSILTQRELESQLVNWRLDTRSVQGLNKSLSDLINWTDMASDSSMKTIDVYHHVLGRILQEKLNNHTLHSLQEVRLKLSENDTINDLLQMTLCSLKQLIPKTEGQSIKSIQRSFPNTLTPIEYYTPEQKPQTVNAIEVPRFQGVVSKPPTNVDMHNGFWPSHSNTGPWNNFWPPYGYGLQYQHPQYSPRSNLFAIKED